MNNYDFIPETSTSVLNRHTGRSTHGQLVSVDDLPHTMATVLFNGDNTFGGNPHLRDNSCEPLPFMLKTVDGARGYARDRVDAHNVANLAIHDKPEDALEYIIDSASKTASELKSTRFKDSLIESILDQFFSKLKDNNHSRVYTITEAKFNALLHVLESLFESRSRKAAGMFDMDDEGDFAKHDYYKSHRLVGDSENPQDYLLSKTPEVKLIDVRRTLHPDTPIIGHLPGQDPDVVNPHFLFDVPRK